MKEHLDRFSGVSRGYARYRPHYPPELYAFILSKVTSRRRAWDVGTGNGQVAAALAGAFDEVIASDISASQLQEATVLPNVSYRIDAAEKSGLDSASIDLITVAQAVHWFELDRFSDEVSRVSGEQCVLFAWCYTLFRTGTCIDGIVDYLYRDILESYWDPHRNLVNEGYASIQFPFRRILCPGFEIKNTWSVEEILGYLRTWSAADKYRQANGGDPVTMIEADLRREMGHQKVLCSTPVHLHGWSVGQSPAEI